MNKEFGKVIWEKLENWLSQEIHDAEGFASVSSFVLIANWAHAHFSWQFFKDSIIQMIMRAPLKLNMTNAKTCEWKCWTESLEFELIVFIFRTEQRNRCSCSSWNADQKGIQQLKGVEQDSMPPACRYTPATSSQNHKSRPGEGVLSPSVKAA